MRKKRENGMAKESGMGDFPRKQFESVLLHSLRIMDQNREYLQMHLARTGDERTRQRWRIWAGEHPPGAHPAGDDGPAGSGDERQAVHEAGRPVLDPDGGAQIAPEIEKQLASG